MERKLTMILAFLLLMVSGGAWAQTQVQGSVTSSEDGEPVIGASVKVVGTNTGTVTDLDGQFTLNVATGAQLEVSYIGMRTQTVKAAPRMSIVLEPDHQNIDEIVVTGYGVTKKAAFTGAATTVGTDKIASKTDPNPIKALDGSVPGLQMSIGSGQPGAPATIYIRGRNSLNSGTQPLYVVDGVPYSSDVVGIRADEGQEISPLASLNANDIESITVLKDAAATSIYGARAANGVIVVTTKKGKSGGTKVNFNAKVGVQMMPAYRHFNYGPVNAKKYKELINEAYLNAIENDGPTKMYTDGYLGTDDYANIDTQMDYLELLYETPFYKDMDVDWMKEVTRTGLTQEYAVDVQGGSSDPRGAKYFLSLSYLNDKAIVIGKDMKRYSFRYNFDQAPSKYVKFGFNTNFVYSETNMGVGGGYFSDPLTMAYMMTPLQPVKNEDGSWNFDTANSGYNPVAQRSKDGDQSLAKQYRILLSPYVTINFTPDLYFTSRAGADVMIVDEFGFWSFLQPQGADIRGMGENSNTSQTLMSLTNTLNYLKTFNQVHNLNVMLGQETQYTYRKRAYLASSNYPVQDMPQAANASTPSDAVTEVDRLALASFFGNAEYDYANKYYASASLRFDGSSRFSKGNRWGTFFSLGAKYRISEEAFMQDTKDWLDNLTLRVSYGTSGNSEVGNKSWYTSRDLYGFGYNYNNIPGAYHEQFGNEDLKWERTGKFNLGLDVAFLKRFTLEFDYYNHLTSDMVFAVPISMGTGLSTYYKNIGKLRNSGIEMTLGAQVFNTKDFKWNVSLSTSHNKNKVVKLSTDDPIEDTYQITEVGKPIYQFYMREYAGVDPETGDALWYLNEEGDETTTNYNKAKKRYVGDANPKWFGAFNSNMTWRDFDFSFQFNYSLGRKIYGDNLRYDEHIGGSFGQQFSEYVYKNRWQKPGDVTDVPRLDADYIFYGTSANSHSSRFLMNGNYLKLRSIVLGYTIPSEITRRFYVSKLRVYVQADNLYTFGASNYRGFDPSTVDANGVQWWNFPNPRNIVFGANVSF